MSSTPWVSHPNDGSLQILPVPVHTSRNPENKCIVHCLYMAIEYIAKEYPNKWVRENINRIKTEEIESEITLNEAGWRPKPDELDKIGDKTDIIEIEYAIQEEPLRNSALFGVAKNQFKRNLPLIPIINAKRLRQNRKAGLHAVVMLGLNNNSVVINDPWGYPYDIVDKEKFAKSWNDTINQYIKLTPGKQRLGDIGGEN